MSAKHQSLQEWHAAGGGVPVRFKGKEHIWHKQVEQHLSIGGELAKVAAKSAKPAAKAVTKVAEAAPQAEALRLAQQRAALPPAKGGLGLPANNTPEQRAAAMGFNKDTYHGTFRDVKKLDPSRGSTESHAGKGVYSTDSPKDASLNYASIYGPDVGAKVGRTMDEMEKDWRRIHSRMKDETLTPRQQEIILQNTVGADNLGVVYPLKVRADKPIHLDAPEANPVRIGPFEHYDEVADAYVDTPHTAKFNEALDEFRELGGEANPIYELVQDYGDAIPARDVFNAVKKTGSESGLYDPFTGDIVSGGVAAGDFMKHFGVDEISHTPRFNAHELNIGNEHTISLNPDNVRSRFAAFDPFRKTAATAAAMGVAAPDLLAKDKKDKKKAQGGAIHLAGGGDPRKRAMYPKMPTQAIIESEGFDPDVPSDLSRAYARRMADKAEYERNIKDQKLTPTQRGVAGLEAAGMLGSAMFEGVQQLPKLLDSKEAYEQAVGKGMYQPRFQPEKAAEYVGNVGDFLEQLETKYKMPQVLPELLGMAPLADAAKRQAGKAVKQGALTAASRMDAGPKSGSMAAQRGIVKMPGGNWLDDSVEKGLDPLKRTVLNDTGVENLRARQGDMVADSYLEERPKTAALNNWVDRNLTNYVKKQMATPDDPVRKLAEQDITHFPIAQDPSWWERKGSAAREDMGGTQMAESDLAKQWENRSDAMIQRDTAKEHQDMMHLAPGMYSDKDEWIKKLPPETNLYKATGDYTPFNARDLGFDHIMDVLKQDVAEGRIRPEQLSKVSMEQAVRRTYEYDQEMAKKMRETAIKQTEGMPVHKEYPEGYKWIELAMKDELPEGWTKTPTGVYVSPTGHGSIHHPNFVKLNEALDYEGKAMGHCVGGYCPDVAAGRSRIYSLRDAKGEPHVTIEVTPGKGVGPKEFFMSDLAPDSLQNDIFAMEREGSFNDPHALEDFIKQSPEYQQYKQSLPPKIEQIKGKGNAVPKKDYLPFVQDFVKGGNWSDVEDLRDIGLTKHESGKYISKAEMNALAKKHFGKIDSTESPETYYKRLSRYEPELLSEADKVFLQDWKAGNFPSPEEGMKAGGRVNRKHFHEPHLSVGGDLAKIAAKSAKAAEKFQHPLIFPRALAKTKEDIRPIAQRIAEQMTGDFVRQDPKVTTNPAGKSRKQFNREQEIPLETRRLIPESEVPVIDYETKLGQSLVGVPGDPTLGSVVKKGTLESSAQPSVELTRVGDVVPEHPVPLFGGPRYGNEERFWASNLGQASPVQNRVNKLSEAHQAPVLGQYIKMAPDSANFAMHNLDALLAIQQPEKLPKAKMEDLNKLIREGSKKYGKFPNFVGFQDPLDVLLNTQFNSNLRKHIAETLTKPTITNELGLVNGLDVVAAITHPELRNMETGISGFSIGEMRPGSNLREFASEHPTYDTDIPGAMIGQSKYPTPYEIAFPDTTAYTRSNLKPGVQEFNMLKMLGPRERIDQQYIDEMKMYEELMKEYTGKKKGGLAQAKKPKKVARHGNTVPN